MPAITASVRCTSWMELGSSTCSRFQLRTAQIMSPMMKNALGGKQHQPVRDVPAAILATLARWCTPSSVPVAKQLTADRDDDQNHAVAERIAQAVEKAQADRVLHRKASARPSTMQLVMIRPTKTDSSLLVFEANACSDLVDNDHQRRDDRHLNDDANVRRQEVRIALTEAFDRHQ